MTAYNCQNCKYSNIEVINIEKEFVEQYIPCPKCEKIALEVVKV